MMTPLWFHNLVAYSVQISLIVTAASIVSLVLRLKTPKITYAYWRCLLAVCLLLPLIQPWTPVSSGPFIATQPPTIHGQNVRVANPANAGVTGVKGVPSPARAGVFPGVWTLGRSWFQSFPTVLFPETFLNMEGSHQEAIAMHELLHVSRRDWLSTLAEEIIRGLLWFKPAVWWLLDRIQLTREQVVDQEVVEHTQDPKDYVQALLEVAGTKGRWEMTPGPLFLARQHLLPRVTLILQDVSLSTCSKSALDPAAGERRNGLTRWNQAFGW